MVADRVILLELYVWIISAKIMQVRLSKPKFS
jgi:hypothetical protein